MNCETFGMILMLSGLISYFIISFMKYLTANRYKNILYRFIPFKQKEFIENMDYAKICLCLGFLGAIIY